ncbi:MAG TPA: peroxidase-related enzyme [Candidatus Dormibacteraeota bacterium]|nr:peroxidase-related enzyme [Candidatus Dormibacteraeota bacterium]
MSDDARPISRFPVPPLEELPDDIRARIEAVAARSGFVPNVFLALAHRPDEWRAFVAYHDALMERESGLTPAEKELIVVATSAANDCLYCVIAHGAIARVRARTPLIADQVAVDWRKADVTERQRAMLAFAVKLAVEPARVDEADFAALRAHGFDDEDIWDIGAITALFAMSNRMAHLTAMRPNDQFYLMGRVPKEVFAQLTDARS